MNTVWRHLYSRVLIPALVTSAHVISLFKHKVRKGIDGRRGLFPTVRSLVEKLPPGKRIWVHSSSMGEFEQAKPIIVALKNRHPDVRILVSFFSPSGYEHSKHYRFADLITYIPFDSEKNAREFVDILRPDAAVFVRYDVWPNHIQELRRRNIPVFLANATMRASSPRLRWPWRDFHRGLYSAMNAILTVSEQDAQQFRRFDLGGLTIAPAGETRYDQVLQRSNEARGKHILQESVLKGKKIIVAGSTWPEDEEVLLPAFRKLSQYVDDVLLVLVPHEPTEAALEEIERSVQWKPRSIRLSDLNDYSGERIILVDSVGVLMALYQYADVAFVGGSFRQNVHNVLEPAVYGIPVVFGPRHANSQEASCLAERGGGFVVHDQQDLYRTFRSLLSDEAKRSVAGKASADIVKENAGATMRFLSYLEPIVWPATAAVAQKRPFGRRKRKK